MVLVRKEVCSLYGAIIDAWNDRDAEAMARPFAADGVVIGFDGSVHAGSEEIAEQMGDDPSGPLERTLQF